MDKKLTLNCGYCDIEMTSTGATENGLFIYEHPGPCLDENGVNRMGNETYGDYVSLTPEQIEKSGLTFTVVRSNFNLPLAPPNTVNLTA